MCLFLCYREEEKKSSNIIPAVMVMFLKTSGPKKTTKFAKGVNKCLEDLSPVA